jgi:hypothetical protein
MAQINKQLAENIVKKLKATKISSGAHIDYEVQDFQGKVVAITSLRHGSSKELGHDHICRMTFTSDPVKPSGLDNAR